MPEESPCIARFYCPTCEPEADPILEILDLRWCGLHTPVAGGPDDVVVLTETYPAGSGEAGGEDNRRWCQLFHRPSQIAKVRRRDRIRRATD
jgi:hypothetical protein